jgi:hypothetical protein
MAPEPGMAVKTDGCDRNKMRDFARVFPKLAET